MQDHEGGTKSTMHYNKNRHPELWLERLTTNDDTSNGLNILNGVPGEGSPPAKSEPVSKML